MRGRFNGIYGRVTNTLLTARIFVVIMKMFEGQMFFAVHLDQTKASLPICRRSGVPREGEHDRKQKRRYPPKKGDTA